MLKPYPCPECGNLITAKSCKKCGWGTGKAGPPPPPDVLPPSSDKCPHCENFITPENKRLLCKKCGKKFCTTCEGWIEKKGAYKGQDVKMRYPLCEGCYEHEYGDCAAKIDASQKDEEERARRRAEEEGKKGPPAEISNSLGMKFILIHPGTFDMGEDGFWTEAKPKHTVRMTKPFYLSIYQVTQKEWESVMGKWEHAKAQYDTCNNPHDPNAPMCCVSWADCQEFIAKLNKKEGGAKYRLPTEAEWEYACRAGSTTKYYFGDDKEKLSKYAWYRDNDGGKPHEVGLKEPNKWGLYDMHGNVWEWCEDWWKKNYKDSPRDDPKGPEKGTYHPIRGGSWGCPPQNCTSSHRFGMPSHSRESGVGLRLARSL